MDALNIPGVQLETETLLRLRYVAGERRRARRQLSSGQAGTVTARRRGRGLEINDIRAWLEGDDVRHIDRNVTARTGVPHVRTFREDRDRTFLLVADFRPSMLFGTKRAFRSIAAAEALTLVGWSMVAESRQVGLFTVGANDPVMIPPRSADRAMSAVIGGLVEAHARALKGEEIEDPPLDTALRTAALRLAHGGTLVLATALDQPGDSFAALIPALLRRISLCLILVTDAFEREQRPGLFPFITWNGERDRGEIVPNRQRPEDPRLKLLADLGVPTIVLEAEAEPDAMMRKIEALDAIGA